MSKIGWQQAADLAEYIDENFEIDAVYSSPFQRCVETARDICVNTGIKAQLEPRLHEFFNEEWFGHDLRSLEMPSLHAIASANDWVEPSDDRERWWPRMAESSTEVDQRLRTLSRRMSGTQVEGVNIVLVGHWASVASLAYAFCPDITIPEVGNASLTLIEQKNRINKVIHKDYHQYLRSAT